MNDTASQLSARQAAESHSRLFELLDELKQVESSINPKLPCRNENNWCKFFKWIDTETNRKLSDQIDVAKQDRLSNKNNMLPVGGDNDNQHHHQNNYDLNNDDNNEECSLIAKVPLKKGQKVFSISRQIMLTTETATKDLDLYDFIKKDSIASGMQNVVLVLHLLNEYSKQERSYWWPYLSILPSKLLPILTLNKNQQQLQYLLASSHIFEALKMLRAIARQYSYFYKRLQSTKLPLRNNFTFVYYAWGVSIVCSRQNEIPSSNRQASLSPIVNALIPILDMCNHDRLSNQATFEDNHSCLLASKDLSINEEISINYGCRSSGEFYIHNGFVPDGVPCDWVPLAIVLNGQDCLYEAKANLLKTLNMPAFGRFKLAQNSQENRHKRDPHLTMFLIVYLLSAQELDYIMSDPNPIGIADELYEYVQYSSSNGRESPTSLINANGTKMGAGEEQDRDETIATMKKRVANCIKEYLSRRAAACVALIDRCLDDYRSSSAKSIENGSSLAMLLVQERSVYASYIMANKGTGK